MNKKYQIIYADPPWSFKTYSKPKDGKHFNVGDTGWRNADVHYPCMDLENIQALPVSELAEKDCVLFMWATYPMLPQALQVIKAWSFTFKTIAFTWVKLNKDKTIFTGMGYWTRSNAEICILATKGHPKRINASVSSVILSQREHHSTKPAEIRERITKLMGDLPRVELFARRKVDGWDCWGNEVESDITL